MPRPRLGAGALVLAASLLLIAVPGARAALTWRGCGGGAQCSTTRVPRDYAQPGGPQLRLALARLPARNPSRRIGSLFVNFGGPGGPGVGPVKEIGGELFAHLNRRFDIVGFDPRGVGRSRPAIDCHADQERLGVYAEPFFRPGLPAATLIRRDRRYVRRCLRRNRGILPYVSTANVARDLDRLRAEVGDGKLSYLGFSYGTFLGATYSTLFPGHVRALVLDGALDPSAYVNRPLRTLDRQTGAFERAFGRFLAACRRNQRACHGFGGRRPRTAFDRLARRLDRHPLAVGRRRLDGDDLRAAVTGDLYGKESWGDLAAMLARAQAGHGALARATADGFFGRRPGGRYDPTLDRYFTIGAIEQRYPRRIGRYLAAGRRSYRRHHHFWFNNGYAELPWGLYPVRPRGVFRGPFTTAPTTPTTLVVGTTFDPATPYAGNRAAARELGHARLLTMDGDGHTAYGGRSACIDRAVNRYLEAGVVPAVGTRCEQETPFGGTAGVASVRPVRERDRRVRRAFVAATRMH